MNIGGLIAAAVGGAAEGYGKGADMEMKKQSELDLKKQLMEAETERQLRVDEIKRGRDVSDRLTEETRTRSPEYLGAVAKADADKFKALIAAGVPEAKAEAMVAEGKATAKTREALAPINAKAADVEFEAGKVLEGKKATAATTAKITEAGSLAGDAGYLTNVAKLATAAKDPEIKMNKDRTDAIAGRASGGGGRSSGPKTETTADLDRIVKRSEADAARILGVERKDLNRAFVSLQKKKDPASVALFEKVKPYMDELDAASTRLKNWKAGVPQPSGSGRDLSGLSAYERDRALN